MDMKAPLLGMLLEGPAFSVRRRNEAF